jgi:hypothetical protein
VKAYVDRYAWEYLGHCPDGQKLLIGGMNIWDQNWISTNEIITKDDPVYHQEHDYRVYIIKKEDNSEIKMAACEYSNCYWGFYEYVDRSKAIERYEMNKRNLT